MAWSAEYTDPIADPANVSNYIAGSAFGFTEINGIVDNIAKIIDSFMIEHEFSSGKHSGLAGDGLSYTPNQLDVNVDDSTIEIVGDALQVKAAGITPDELSFDPFSKGKYYAITESVAPGGVTNATATITTDIATSSAVGTGTTFWMVGMQYMTPNTDSTSNFGRIDNWWIAQGSTYWEVKIQYDAGNADGAINMPLVFYAIRFTTP